MNTTRQTADKSDSSKRPPTPTPVEEITSQPPSAQLVIGLGATPPSAEQAAATIQRVPDSKIRQEQFQSVQQRYGNRYAGQIAHVINATSGLSAVQRHDAGAALLGGKASVPGSGGAASVEPVATQEGPSAQDRADGSASPTELSMPTLQTAFAQDAIRRSFGSVAGREIVTGNITVLPNQAALYRQYDQIQIDSGATNRDTGQPWAYGDKAIWNNARGLRTNAFAHSGNIWIDATQTDPTATVHEMLHVNTSSGFLNLVGRAINEGITQRLAVRAVQATGQSVAGSENTYQSEQGAVNALIGVVGEGAVINAYFNSPDMLVTAYESVMGEDSFRVLKRTLNDTPEGYAAALRILQPPSVTQKIAAINALLDWWVSDDDLTIIESIVSTCSSSDRQQIAAAIQPRITSLVSLGQRTRLRVILGTV